MTYNFKLKKIGKENFNNQNSHRSETFIHSNQYDLYFIPFSVHEGEVHSAQENKKNLDYLLDFITTCMQTFPLGFCEIKT